MTRKLLVPLVAVAAIAIAAFLLLRHPGGSDVAGLDASGTVEATDAALGFQVPGRVPARRGARGRPRPRR